jgi:hypothetical protein
MNQVQDTTEQTGKSGHQCSTCCNSVEYGGRKLQFIPDPATH